LREAGPLWNDDLKGGTAIVRFALFGVAGGVKLTQDSLWELLGARNRGKKACGRNHRGGYGVVGAGEHTHTHRVKEF
jgi:hypothetical protein